MVKHVTLHLTQKCNLSCEYCHTAAGFSTTEDSKISTEIIKNLFSEPIYSVSLAGGEPFAVKEKLYNFIELIPKDINNIAITTNGIQIDEHDLDYCKSKRIRLQFSIDGMSEQHDSNRGKGNYSRTLKNLLDALKKGIRVDVLTIVSKRNLNNMKAFLNEIDNLGIQNITLLHFTPKGRGSYHPDEEVETLDWIDFVRRMRADFKTVNVRVWIQPRFLASEDINKIDSERRINMCNHFKYDFAYVDLTKGDVYPCGLAYNTPITIGNLHDKPLNELVKSHLEYKHSLPDKCNDCAIASKCLGGALCYSYFYYNDLNKKDPKCLIEQGVIPICPFPAVFISGPAMKTQRPTIV